MTKEQISPSCAACEVRNSNRICEADDGGASKGCPTLVKKELLRDANKENEKPDVKHFARQASLQEAACYANRHTKPYVLQPSKTRLVEICEFAGKRSRTASPGITPWQRSICPILISARLKHRNCVEKPSLWKAFRSATV